MDNVAKGYDYRTSWGKYVSESEGSRYLSLSDSDMLKICDCIDLNDNTFNKTSGGIPIHYENGRLYLLKEGPHTRVEGESGCKKSRTVGRGSVISAILNRDSIIVTDPKGEISSDSKIKWLLKNQNVDTHILDFRTFDKDCFNPLSHSFNLYKKGKVSQAMSSIDKIVGTASASYTSSEDTYWVNQSADHLRNILQIMLLYLSEEENGISKYNFSSVKEFLRMNRGSLKRGMQLIAARSSLDCVKKYSEVVQMDAEKTYSCIISFALSMIAQFTSSTDLLRMLSADTFDIRQLYEKPSALFLVIPDEHRTYNNLSGCLIDQFYQMLVEYHSENFKDNKMPPCNIKFICDEAANININDLSSKVSASRSRQIDWTLIFQSEKQMAKAYQQDWPSIEGNCKNILYLGSSDYEILKRISEHAGIDERSKPHITVDNLRHMKKEHSYKDALLMTGNHLFCAKLPDYDSFEFLKTSNHKWPNRVQGPELEVVTPEKLFFNV